MTHNSDEVDKVRLYVQEIIDEQYMSKLHELKKKLSVALSKELEQEAKLAGFEQKLAIYKDCHDCHRVNVEKSDAQTQTNRDEEQILDVVNESDGEERSGAESPHMDIDDAPSGEVTKTNGLSKGNSNLNSNHTRLNDTQRITNKPPTPELIDCITIDDSD